MTRVLLDTNVLLDVLLTREPWVAQAAAILQANDDGKIDCYVTASTLTDVFYITRRLTDASRAKEAVQKCLQVFEISTVDRQSLEQALRLPGSDFEDNLQIICALRDNLDVIVTRDNAGFQGALISVLSPEDFLSTLP